METTHYNTHVKNLQAQIDHALSMAAAFHEVVATSAHPPDRLLFMLEEERHWRATAACAQACVQRLRPPAAAPPPPETRHPNSHPKMSGFSKRRARRSLQDASLQTR